MALQAHIAELKRKHAELERELEDMLQHPSIDDPELQDIKRRKLALKDEIERLSHGAVAQ